MPDSKKAHPIKVYRDDTMQEIVDRFSIHLPKNIKISCRNYPEGRCWDIRFDGRLAGKIFHVTTMIRYADVEDERFDIVHLYLDNAMEQLKHAMRQPMDDLCDLVKECWEAGGQ